LSTRGEQRAPVERPRWQTLAHSVRGASHYRDNLPNQDAKKVAPLRDGAGAVLAVADGHGNPLHARSDRGSKFAVTAAVDVLGSYVLSLKQDVSQQALLRGVKSELPGRLVREWRKLVEADLAANPPQWASNGNGAAQAAKEQPDLLYGTTLIAAALTPRFAIYLQIGDGDLVTVSATGAVERKIEGPDLPGNRTESLCQSDAEARFRTDVEFFAGGAPSLVMLSSDGYSNSYSKQSFFDVGRDLKKYIETDGLTEVDRNLESWLEETTREGSKDDITVALAWSGQKAVADEPEDDERVDEDDKESRREGLRARLRSLIASSQSRTIVVAVAAFVVALLVAVEARRYWTADVTVATSGMMVAALDGFTSVAASADGKTYAFVSRDGIVHTSDGRQIGPPTGAEGFVAVAMSADGKRVAAATADGAISVWEPGEATNLVLQMSQKPTALALSPDGERIAVAGERVWLLNARNGKLEGPSFPRSLARTIAFAHNGKWLAFPGADDSVVVAGMEGSGSPRVVKADSRGGRAIAIAPDGERIVVAGEDRTIRILDARGKAAAAPVHGPGGDAHAVDISPDGKLFVSGGADGVIRVSDLASGKEVRAFKGAAGPVRWAMFLADGKSILSAGADSTLRRWEL
jgi:serine/threonine protein phosphatase PrpC/DNA-binding beta-propeller fold protein YncE